LRKEEETKMTYEASSNSRTREENIGRTSLKTQKYIET